MGSIDDPIAPQAITNLAVSSCVINSCVFAWTATGDDGAVGIASSYDIRYSTSNITEANWESATQVTGEPNPQSAGATESFVVNGLTSNTAYYFAIKAIDESFNISGLSNIANANTKAPVPVGSLNIPLTVQEALPQGVIGINRNSEPVSVGIPLKDSDNITDVSQLGLSGANKGQFRVLARWPSGNIKWILADFQASVNANGSNTSIVLTKGQGNFGGSNLAADNGQSIVVNTGSAEFTMKKSNFNIFDKVMVNEQILVNPDNNGKLVIRDQNNKEFSSINDSSSTATIEENGPVKTIIKSQGSLKDSLGNRLIDYTLRMHFYQGKSYVTSDVTLRNASESNVNPVNFKSAELVVPLALGATRSFEFARKNDAVNGSLLDGETAYLYQAFSKDKTGGDTWRWDTAPLEKFGAGAFDYVQQGLEIKHNGNILNALGSRDDWTQGWSELKDSSGQGLTMALRWMSAMWPAGFEFSGNGDAKVELFSKYNSKANLKFAWGAHETREVIFDFHTQSGNNQNVLYNLQYPLVAKTDYTHYRDTGVIYGEKQLATKEEHLQWFQKQGLTSFPTLGNIPMEVYRWYYFPEGGGFNQIDFPLAYLLNFLRTGNGGYYTLGEQISRYNSDNAVMHSNGFDLSLTSIDPETQNSGSMNGKIYDLEHAHWLGLPVAYYLTGNEAIKEAIIDYGEKLSRESGPKPSMWEMRVWSRFYRSYALMYEFTGNSKYRQMYEQMTNTVLDSRDTGAKDNPPDFTPYGRNLERGYMWSPHQGCYGGNSEYCQKRLLSDFFLTLLYSEAVWQNIRVMNDLNISYRQEELEAHLFGIAQFVYNEMYLTRNGGTAYRDFGYLYDYALDEINMASVSLRPEDTSRLMTFAYERTGDTKYLDVGGKLLWGTTSYASDLTPSEMQGQSFIFTDLRRDKTGWRTISGVNAQNNGNGSYTLSWIVPQNTAGYQIKYSDKPIVDWLGFNQVTRTYRYEPTQYTAFFAALNVPNEPTPVLSGNTQSYTISGLDPNKQWHFALKYQGSLTPGPSDTTAPSVPTNLTATAISSSQINLSWTASTDNVGVTGYRLEHCQGSTCSNFTQIATPTGTSHTDTGLTVNTAYRYQVRAIDEAKNLSEYSTITNATTLSQYKPSDLNQDTKVDQLDLDILKQDWNRTDKPPSDLNQDGIVDSRDLGIMMSSWNK